MKVYAKQAAFILAVYAIAKLVNTSYPIPVIGAYLPS